MTDKPTIDRETSIEALSVLAEADAFIAAKYGTRNTFRTETITKMEGQLGVKVKVRKEQ